MIVCSTAGLCSSCRTAESFKSMWNENEKNTPFYEDVYLYDLNSMEMPPLAYRSARGGKAQPDLLSLINLPAREWHDIARQLYECSVYLWINGGVVLLPVHGSLGRLVAVVKTTLSLPAFAYLAQCAGQKEAYFDAQIKETAPKLQAHEYEAAQSAVRTVTELRLLIEACASARNAFDAEECIQKAAEIMGVTLMPQEKAEFAPMQGQGLLPDMQHAGQALFTCVFTLLSIMRNEAHARSGWLYAAPCETGYTLQALARCPSDADTATLDRLRIMLQDCGVALGARTFALPVKPPKQYAYMSRKITDPRKPLCARCGCLDTRCKSCTVIQFAALPYVCDAALLGIKALPHFEQ